MNLRLCAVVGTVFVLLSGSNFLSAQDRPSIEIWPTGTSGRIGCLTTREGEER